MLQSNIYSLSEITNWDVDSSGVSQEAEGVGVISQVAGGGVL